LGLPIERHAEPDGSSADSKRIQCGQSALAYAYAIVTDDDPFASAARIPVRRSVRAERVWRQRVAGAIFDFSIRATVHRSRCETSLHGRPLHVAPANFREPMARGAPGLSNLLIRVVKNSWQLTVTKSLQPHVHGRVDLRQTRTRAAVRRECGLHVHPVQIDCTISQDITEDLE
jgi:hypothetical protein